MIDSKGYAAQSATEDLAPWKFERRDLGADDIQMEILYSGICHSDIHQARNEWGGSIFPMVPGHEIVGRVTAAGENVKNFKIGDLAGVGCIVDSCRTCPSCLEHEEELCENGMVGTYNSIGKDGLPTYGGYSNNLVVDENYALHIPSNLDLKAVAPLLCAGITTYSPLKAWGVKAGQKVAVIGLGGLGHMGVKLAKAMGAEVTVISHSDKKREDSKRLGAVDFVNSSNEEELAAVRGKFDFVLNTVSAPHSYDKMMQLVKANGAMVLVGAPPEPSQIAGFSLIMGKKKLAGSLIGGIKETQEMLDFCADHNITADVEIITMDQVNEAYERMMKGDVRYRFVIDVKASGL